MLTNYHGRLIEIIKPKLSQSIEETLEENDVIKKLSELDKLIASTTHSQNHQAWRPSSSHGSGGPEQCMIAHDYLVSITVFYMYMLIKLLFVCLCVCRSFQYNLSTFASLDILSVSCLLAKL